MDAKQQNNIEAFAKVIREGMPELIQNATGGEVLQTSDRKLLARTDKGEDAFQIFLNNGASYRFRLQQVGEAEDAGSQECGTLTALTELDEQGYCLDCARDRWDRLTAEEKTAWCKADRMHWPYEAKGPMSVTQLQYVSDLLAAHPFRWAKTLPRNPHEYTLRHEWADVGEEVFEKGVRMIREHGYTEWFGGYPWRMLNANGYKYWTYYSSSVEEVIVLNRKRLPGHEPRKAREDASR